MTGKHTPAIGRNEFATLQQSIIPTLPRRPSQSKAIISDIRYSISQYRGTPSAVLGFWIAIFNIQYAISQSRDIQCCRGDPYSNIQYSANGSHTQQYSADLFGALQNTEGRMIMRYSIFYDFLQFRQYSADHFAIRRILGDRILLDIQYSKTH